MEFIELIASLIDVLDRDRIPFTVANWPERSQTIRESAFFLCRLFTHLLIPNAVFVDISGA